MIGLLLAVATASPTPLSLHEAIVLARDNSFEAQASQKQLAASEAAKRQTQDALMPTLGIQVSGNYSRLPDVPALSNMGALGQQIVGYPTNGAYADVTSEAQLPLFDGFATRHALAMADVQLEVERLNLARSRQEAMTNAATAYLQLLRARRLASVARDVFLQGQEHLRLGNERLAAGFGTRAELLQLEADMAQDEVALIQATNKADAARLTLEAAMNTRLGDRPLEEEPPVPPQGENLQDQLQATFERREDLRQQVLKQRMSEERAGLEAANYWPHIKAFGQYTQRGTHLPVFTGGVTINWMAFDGFLVRDRIAQASHQAQADAARLEELKRATALEVRLLDQSVREALERIPASSRALRSSTEAYRIATERYRLGFAVLADLLDARTALLDARTGYIGATYDWRVAQIRLARAMGLDLAAYLTPPAR